MRQYGPRTGRLSLIGVVILCSTGVPPVGGWALRPTTCSEVEDRTYFFKTAKMA